jgi:hypothetical protein
MPAAVRALRKGQENLGDLHDRHALADSLSAYGKDDGVDLEHVQLARQVLEGEVMHLHSQYLARRSGLRAACSEAEQVAAQAHGASPVIAVGAALAVSGMLYGRHGLIRRR